MIVFLLRFEWLLKRQKIFVILKIKIFGFLDGNWQAFGLFLVNYNTLNYFMVTILTTHIPGLIFIEFNSSVKTNPTGGATVKSKLTIFLAMQVSPEQAQVLVRRDIEYLLHIWFVLLAA